MSITTIRPPKRRVNFKKILTLLVLFGSIFGLISYYQERIPEILGISRKSTISISSLEAGAKVFINGNQVGETPIDGKEIKPGLVNLSIKGPLNGYTTTLNIVDNSENIIYRELGFNKELSSGVNIWEGTYDEKKVEVIADPKTAKIAVNDKEVSNEEVDKLESGNYKFKVSAEGYKELVFSVNIRKGYKTNIEVKLPPLPYEEEIYTLNDFENLYVIKSSNPDVYTYSKDWIDYFTYFQKRRGVNIKNLGVVKDSFFEYFIDTEGRVYDKNLKQIDDFDSIKDLNSKKVGLLYKTVNKDVLNEKNKTTIAALYSLSKLKTSEATSPSSTIPNSGVVLGQATKKYVIITADWLRVRSEPAGTEIGKANKGEELELISDEQISWYKIKTKDGKVGFIAKDFSEIKK
jgi:hypothetical protein